MKFLLEIKLSDDHYEFSYFKGGLEKVYKYDLASQMKTILKPILEPQSEYYTSSIDDII